MTKYYKLFENSISAVRKYSDNKTETVVNYPFHTGIDIVDKNQAPEVADHYVEITEAQYNRLRKIALHKLMNQ